MRALQAELSVPGEITIGMILQAPGVMRFSENGIEPDEVWPALEEALGDALGELIKMREREGKHLAKDLIQRLKVVRQSLKEVRKMYPAVTEKYRETLLERIRKAGFDLEPNDERLAQGSRLLRRSLRRFGRADPARKSSRPVRPSPAQGRTGRPHSGIYYSGNFPRAEYVRRESGRRRNLPPRRGLQVRSGEDSRTNPKS